MSGSGKGNYSSSSFKKREEVSCNLLEDETTLCNPNENLLSSVKVGNIYPVALDGSTITVKKGKDVLGTIETPKKGNFIQCLKSGTFYVAKILFNEDGVCRIKIYAQSL